MKRDIIAPLVVGGLALAFTAVSLVVWVSRGQQRLIASKLLLGGLLLTWTGTLSTGCAQRICYAAVRKLGPPRPGVSITFQEADKAQVRLSLSRSNVLHGTVTEHLGGPLSFRLVDLQQKTVQSKDILPVDGQFDARIEQVEITIDPSLPAGSYLLSIYRVSAEDQTMHPSQLVGIQYRLLLTE